MEEQKYVKPVKVIYQEEAGNTRSMITFTIDGIVLTWLSVVREKLFASHRGAYILNENVIFG